MIRKPATPNEWDYERRMMLDHIRALLLTPTDKESRRKALFHLTEIFEDEGLEGVKP
jgi:hypothetical protein